MFANIFLGDDEISSALNRALDSALVQSQSVPEWVDLRKKDGGLHYGPSSLRMHTAGFEQWMLDMIPRNPRMLATAEALIGSPIQPQIQVRLSALVRLPF